MVCVDAYIFKNTTQKNKKCSSRTEKVKTKQKCVHLVLADFLIFLEKFMIVSLFLSGINVHGFSKFQNSLVLLIFI